MQLQEYKNVSDEVARLSDEVYSKILKNCGTSKKKKSRITGAIYTEGSFDVNSSGIFIGFDSLHVDYLMYYADNTQQYNTIMYTVGQDANSYGDYDTRTVKIVSGFIGENLSPDLMGNISHEIDHLFEYDNGREKRADLYQRVIEMAQNGKTEEERYAAMSLYYTFQHERSAFVQEFYGFLCQERPLHLNFGQLLKYSEYAAAKRCFDYVKNHQNDEVVKQTINRLGYDRHSFLKRLNFGLKKLERKLCNAYMRFRQENQTTNESFLRSFIREETERLFESEMRGSLIEWGIESVFMSF